MKREPGYYWTSVKDRLPEETKRVLVMTTSGTIKICYRYKDEWENDGPGTLKDTGYEAAFWHPLPITPQQNKEKRKTGFYWVKVDDHWFIAYFTQIEWRSAYSVIPFKEEEFMEINETRITAPDEQQG